MNPNGPGWDIVSRSAGKSFKKGLAASQPDDPEDHVSDSMSRHMAKLMREHSLEDLFSTAAGLPSRVRRFIKKVWKLQDEHGPDWLDVADDLAETAEKILRHRFELIVYVPIISYYGKQKMANERVVAMAARIEECDALMLLHAAYFSIGMSSFVSDGVSYMVRRKESSYVGALLDIVKFGETSQQWKNERRAEALKILKEGNHEIPTRERG